MGSTHGDLDYPLQLCNEYYGKAYGPCERRWWENEKPAHMVTVNGFWIDRTEVTSAQYRQCVEAGSCEPPTRDTYYSDSEYDKHPVVYVTWHQASGYCEWADARLLTEAEWEYAARGPESLKYPWGNKFDGMRVNYCDANCEFDWPDISVDDGYSRTAPVGSYPEGASWSGALDLSGNVWEWTADWYDANYYASSPSRNPTGPDAGVERVRRGGSWHYSADGVRGTSRFGVGPDNADNFQGFRCAKTF